MGPAHQHAKEVLRQEREQDRPQVELTEASRRFLADLLEDRVQVAVDQGITSALSEDNAKKFASTMARAMVIEFQTMAKEKSAEMAGSLVKDAAKRVFGFVFLGLLVYALGGWTGLAALLKFASTKAGV